MTQTGAKALYKENLKQFGRDVLRSYWILLKIMVPALVVVKFLEELGLTEVLALGLAPLMSTLGLPSEFGFVWAAAMLTNLYTAMVVFYQLADGNVYSVAQVSTLALLLLLSHALPVEGAVAKVIGVPWRLTLLLRILGSYLLAFVSMWLMRLFDYGEHSSAMMWQPSAQDDSLVAWLLSQLEMLLGILFILAALMAFLRLLTFIGFDKVLAWLLRPLTKMLSIDKKATNVTIIGLMLGLSFGAGLMIDESRKGLIEPRDMKIAVCFLGLCHSIIEDTFLMLLLGADIIPILLGRLIFSVLVVAVIARVMFSHAGPVAQT